ncbi:hypothetical protein AWN76_014595 [Rhodothermaceae bacterium RA]|nr:hypothetical protein AWN76_014595 [Rhodothermaceae bacterium RA]
MPASAPPCPPDAPAFADIPVTPTHHFRLSFYAAVYHVAHYTRALYRQRGDDPDAVWVDHPVLARYDDDLRPYLPADLPRAAGPAWWDQALDAWARRASAPLPLHRLAALGLGAMERRALLIAGLVEEEARLGTLFATLQAPLPGRRPCLELIGRIAASGHEAPDPWHTCRPLLDLGLLACAHTEAPRSEWLLRVPPPVWTLLRGEAPETALAHRGFRSATSFPALDAVVAAPAIRERLAQIPALVRSGQADLLLLRGPAGSDQETLAGALARALDRHLLLIDGVPPADEAAVLGPLCLLAGALPVLRIDPAPGETVALPALPGYDGPLGVILGLAGGVRSPDRQRLLTLTIPVLPAAERRLCWRQALPTASDAALDAITERFLLPAGTIRQVAPLAETQAALARRTAVTCADVRAACRLLNRQRLDTLAEPLPATGSWAHLVVSDAAQRTLRALMRRCRHRERLLERLGPAFGSSMNRGVRALFAGPSGTGKTLAARILAAELGMDLYRVDLAAVVNKYIGETEKNLHHVFAAAEALDVILLLDEGDALLGSRTDVRTANDRYANLETNYLLQRLEHYQGIVLVTTNLGDNIDRAFQRRMDVVVDFLPPQAEERLRIWHLHLPPDHAVAPAFLQDLAARYRLTGGQIRNAALHATLLALDQGDAAVGARHVEAGVSSEYHKAGATCPPASSAPGPVRRQGMQAFLQTL